MGTMADRSNGGVNSMSEAHVTLRLAFWLLERTGEGSHADIAIDGAHVRIRGYQHNGIEFPERLSFPIREFLESNGCESEEPSDLWREAYRQKGRYRNVLGDWLIRTNISKDDGPVLVGVLDDPPPPHPAMRSGRQLINTIRSRIMNPVNKQ
jgi:hypothetical protein